jgi:hypothetical protein
MMRVRIRDPLEELQLLLDAQKSHPQVDTCWRWSKLP